MPKQVEVKSILNKHKRRDPWFLDDYSVNLYSGCSFNCLFCYIRGSKYGTNMERSTSVKSNGIEILDKQLAMRAKKNEHGIIVLSSVTDPYLHFEEQEMMTRKALEVILKHRFPVHMITRSDLISRDFDLLKEIDEQAVLPSDLQPRLGRGTIVSFSFSTVDDKVASIFEPGAPAPSQRLGALRKTKEAGFLTGVSMMPLLPWLSDTTESLATMFSAFKSQKADYVLPATLTLFGNGQSDSKTLTLRVIEKHFPELISKYQKYFKESTELPDYYRKAFDKKMDEMCREYGIRKSILAP